MTPDWHEVSAWIENKLSLCRHKNDGDLDPNQTAQLRGQIQILKELAALPATLERQKAMQSPATDGWPDSSRTPNQGAV